MLSQMAEEMYKEHTCPMCGSGKITVEVTRPCKVVRNSMNLESFMVYGKEYSEYTCQECGHYWKKSQK